MSEPREAELKLELLQKRLAAAETRLADGPPLSFGDDGGTSGGMEPTGLPERVARLEGGTTTLQWSVGVVSAALLAAAGLIVALQVFTFSRVASLEAKVDALPDQINRNLLELNRTLSQSITAARSAQQPTVIVVPQPGGAPVPPQAQQSPQ